jgi:hypothetical protein
MAGFRTTTGVYELKKALFDIAAALWATTHPEFEQHWGQPLARPDEYAQWVDGIGEQEPATMSTNRSRDEVVTVAVEMFCIRRGDVDTAREAEEYVFARLGELERHIRMTNATVNGVAMWCALTRVANETVPGKNYQGHLAAIRGEFTARIRITG